MKQLFLTLVLALMSVMVSVPASASTGNNVKDMMPAGIIVKQITHFNDGRTLTLYFKKQGSQCEIYSPCNVKDFIQSDIKKVQSTNFEVVDRTEGKLYQKTTTGEVMRVLNQMISQYR